MTEHKALARLRAVINNQADAGENDVLIPLSDALDILGGLEDLVEALDQEADKARAKADERAWHLAAEQSKSARASEYRRQYAGLMVDLGMTEENPGHYKGDGIVSCSRAMRSMLTGWEVHAGEPVPLACAYWAVTAFKYLWRFPLKGNPREDLMKSVDCANRALDAWEE